eukprot:scaffold59842_cov64-Phaeocystis_antarctica.AAC.8
MNAYARDLRTSRFVVQLEKLVLIADASRKHTHSAFSPSAQAAPPRWPLPVSSLPPLPPERATPPP